LLIQGARIATDATTAISSDLWIRNGSISFSPAPNADHVTLDLSGFMVMPGLINSHDHLELNLFPKLGEGVYPNASAWAKDIYRPNDSPVRQHLAVRKDLRLAWGAVKNVLSGVTTVAHHNEMHSVLLDASLPVRVIRRYGWAHSVAFSTDWLSRFHETPPGYPFIIHAAEGTDEEAREEIHTLHRAGALDRDTVLVHGVAIGIEELSLVEHHETSLVWCPSSNCFTLGRTVEPCVLQSSLPIALGTDSAMTGNGDLLDELHFARRFLPAKRLFEMATIEAAKILKLPCRFGLLREHSPADLIAMRDNGTTPAETLLAEMPELVIVRGRVVLVSTNLVARCAHALSNPLHGIDVEGRGRYFLDYDVSDLFLRTRRVLGTELRLAGKAVAA
jgi:cytosine/adenosine deaminase-related metal-dependent hydrolase